MICNLCNKQVQEIRILDNFTQGMAIDCECHGENITIFMTYFDYADREKLLVKFK